MGVTGAQLARELSGLGLTAIGANCGNNLVDTEAALAEMHAAAPEMMLIAKANAGMPRYEGSKLIYDGTPDVMVLTPTACAGTAFSWWAAAAAAARSTSA